MLRGAYASAWATLIGPMRRLSVAPGTLKLNTLTASPGSRKPARKLGRGRGSGLGKTSGRGHKGQKARSGGKSGIPRGHEGGQVPVQRKFPKHGFRNFTRVDYERLHVGKLQRWVECGRIVPSGPQGEITMKDIGMSGIVGRIRQGVKLLGGGRSLVDRPLNVQVTEASKTAVEAIEKHGGGVQFVYYNRLGLRALLKPDNFELIPRFARPPQKWVRKHPNFLDANTVKA